MYGSPDPSDFLFFFSPEGLARETSVSLHLKGTWETQNHQAFCVSLVLVSFTLIYRAACPLFNSETLHNQSFSHI